MSASSSTRCRCLAVVMLGLIVVACPGPSRRTTDATPPRVAVLALDGGTWDLLGPYMERGLLPNLAGLRERGAAGPLQSIRPSSSPVVWTTVATGKMPRKHGINWFVWKPQGGGKPRLELIDNGHERPWDALPAPMVPLAYVSPGWHMSSGWYRWKTDR